MVPRDWVDLSVFTDSKYDISSEIELSFIVAEYYTQINFQTPNALSNDFLIEMVAHRTLMMAMPKILTAVIMLDRCPFESHVLIEEVCRTHQNIENNSIVAQLKLVSQQKMNEHMGTRTRIQQLIARNIPAEPNIPEVTLVLFPKGYAHMMEQLYNNVHKLIYQKLQMVQTQQEQFMNKVKQVEDYLTNSKGTIVQTPSLT